MATKILALIFLFIFNSGAVAQIIPFAVWNHPAMCTGTPWGTVSNGYSNTAYQSTTPANSCASVAQTRTCTSGTMSGSYTNTSCTNGCTGTPWGNVSTGYSNTAYATSSPSSSCASVAQTRTCTNGALSGSYGATSCASGCDPTSISACDLSAMSSGGSAGSCSGGYSGGCSYTCSYGTWLGNYNSCTYVPPTVTCYCEEPINDDSGGVNYWSFVGTTDDCDANSNAASGYGGYCYY